MLAKMHSFLIEKNQGVEDKSEISDDRIKEIIAEALRDFAKQLAE